MIDLNAIRSSIIANVSARQAGSRTARLLQISNDVQTNSNTMRSMCAMKARILFFASHTKKIRDKKIQGIVSGSFSPLFQGSDTEQTNTNSNYESVVNLNSSNNVKSSDLETVHDSDDIVSMKKNSLVNRG